MIPSPTLVKSPSECEAASVRRRIKTKSIAPSSSSSAWQNSQYKQDEEIKKKSPQSGF